MFLEKESYELLREFMPILDEEVDDISKSGVNVNISGEERKVICVKSHMTLCDGKMITNLCSWVAPTVQCVMAEYSDRRVPYN